MEEQLIGNYLTVFVSTAGDTYMVKPEGLTRRILGVPQVVKENCFLQHVVFLTYKVFHLADVCFVIG